ncbi:hypothetical protein JTE90_013992 [Oedothorax gibbosus]|uniref:Serine/threonine-protein kinase receptor n=1 Tax=Oedothorax gibbosus TaxID=931172 RepID=A0AAV6UCG6_9ARAC|nr:hypothetical protein JTE90_013992 [Oedothorax gibbosus]
MRTKEIFRGIFHIVIICKIAGFAVGQDTLCAYSKKDTVKISTVDKSAVDEDADLEPFLTGELLEGNTTERCPSTTFCYSLWQVDASNKNITVLVAQGCWSAAEFDCRKDECISTKKPQKAINNTTTKFCCCQGNFCNVNVSDAFLVEDDSESTPRFVEPTSNNWIVIISVIISAILLVAIALVVIMCRPTQKPNPDSVHLKEPILPPSPTFNLENLNIAESIGHGRYGRVFRGVLYGQSVAVKIFPSQHRNNYLNERFIYCLPFMEHSCLPKLIGAEERKGPDERPEYLLVLSYAPNGCLQEYLTSRTIDWPSLCKMAQSITQGLAHLHMEIRKDGKLKECVAHRDLTSRNIVIKADGSCMLVDFGFAIRICGSKYYMNGDEQVAESTSLVDVGTLRYMAPEVLEGAVNLRDCEASLKQIDVYSLGLIFWELATRCSDLFQGLEVPEYKAPFVAEIGLHPTMEQLQHLVVKRKSRPLFPDIWKDTNPAVRALKETIEDCWDQDAEARLTALCVEERLVELPVMWDRFKAGSAILGVSSTINPTAVDINTTSTIIQTNSNGWFRGSTYEMPVMRSNLDSLSPTNWNIDSRYSGDFSMSENTAETSITMSPTELTPRSLPSNNSNSGNNLKNLSINNNVTPGVKVTVPLQPYQGKNPTMERNLIMEPAEDITISGNSLIERGDKFNTRNNSSNSFNFENDLFNTFQTGEVSESNALVPNDVLSQSTRSVNPIPYVQNAVHIVSTMPKQPNVPGNGHSILMPNGQKKKPDKGFVSGFKNFFKFPKEAGKNSAEGATVPKAPELPTVIVPKLSNTANTVPKPPNFTNLTKMQSMDTEVYVMDPNDEFSMTQTVVRPVANRQVYSQMVAEDSGLGSSENPERNRKSPFQNGFVQSQTHPQLCTENGNPKMKRPNTLPITKTTERQPNILVKVPSNGSGTHIKNDSDEGSSASNQLKNPRFSLYDDRIMTSSTPLYQQIQVTPCKLGSGSPHISASVPLSIDAACESEVINFHNTYQSMGSEPRVENQ